jgi:hypothetical protein
MEYDEMDNNNSFDSVGSAVAEEEDTKTSKQRKFEARRRIEDWADFRRMRDDLGWMDDFDTEFGEVY